VVYESSDVDDAAPCRVEDDRLGGSVKSEHRELVRRLTLSEEATLTDVMTGRLSRRDSLLDERTQNLVRVAGLIALDARTTSLQAATEAAFASGARDEEIAEVLLVVAPIVGTSRVDSVLPRLRRVLRRD
jgi:alkylhydroperoxidase/carboxymuconolactone decarboxylase family protein YurZ